MLHFDCKAVIGGKRRPLFVSGTFSEEELLDKVVPLEQVRQLQAWVWCRSKEKVDVEGRWYGRAGDSRAVIFDGNLILASGPNQPRSGIRTLINRVHEFYHIDWQGLTALLLEVTVLDPAPTSAKVALPQLPHPDLSSSDKNWIRMWQQAEWYHRWLPSPVRVVALLRNRKVTVEGASFEAAMNKLKNLYY